MVSSMPTQITEMDHQDVRALLAMIFTNSFDAIVITDGDPVEHRVIYANPAFCRMTGYELDELIGHSPRKLAGPNTNRDVTQRLKSALKSGQPFNGAATNYRKDGSTYPVQWNIYPMHDEQGQVRLFVSIQKDLSELRHTLNQLKSSSQYFKRFLDELVQTRGTKVIESHQHEKAEEALKANAKMLADYVNTASDAEIEDDFFDFDDMASAADDSEVKEKLTAKEFIKSLSVEKSVIDDICGMAASLHALIDTYEPTDLSESERKELIEEMQEFANAVFFVEEFIDISISLSELAVGMYHYAEHPIDMMMSEALKGLSHDIDTWVNEVFVTQASQDIHWLDNSIIGSCKQILVFSRLKAERENDD